MNKRSSYKIITTGFIGAVLAATLILSVGAIVVEEADATKRIQEKDRKNSEKVCTDSGISTCCSSSSGMVCNPNEPVAPLVLPTPKK